MADDRPKPEKFLKQAQEEERQKLHGKLKIYLGAAPGVGKTFAMLQDAIAKREQGLDVVVGIIESHGRKETEALINKLEILPRQVVKYRDHELKEFDFDAALKRNPALILMDEMAHTNAPGSRHTKRWQDIKELLERGIDVYTTLNVQHIESLNDVVSQIVHAPIKETVPDSMIEMADTIELVDLPPEDLLKRLQEGKVYVPQQAELATERFFRKGNLTALRELALRTTAARVSSQVLLYRQDLGIKHVWPTKEKLLVCVSAAAHSIKLIRTIYRLAASLQAEWMAVYVDMPHLQNAEELRNNAMKNLQLAEQLGAKTRVLSGTDVVATVLQFAREQNVTQIIIGKKIRSRFREFFTRSMADELMRQSGEIDVHIVTDKQIGFKIEKKAWREKVVPWHLYTIAFVTSLVTTLINWLLSPYQHNSTLLLIYLLGITFVAFWGALGPVIFSILLCVLAFDFFFLSSAYRFVIPDWNNLFTLAIMVSVSWVISYLIVSSRKRTEIARFVENQTTALHKLSRQLASTRGVDKLLDTGVQYLAELFSSDVVAMLPENGLVAIQEKQHKKTQLSSKEQSVAQWVFDMGQMAGLGTETLPFSNALYMPLLTSQGTIGVLRIFPRDHQSFSTDQLHLLEACANQIALALEVDRLQEQTRKSEFEVETDRVRNTLLNAISHDLRAPLASIMATANTQIEMADELTPVTIKKLAKEIYLQSEELSRLINNLLQISYLEAETVVLQKQFYPLDELINAVLKLASKRLKNKRVDVQIQDGLPEVPFDYALMQEAFINLIDNAVKFTPPESSIEITVQYTGQEVTISVEDEGPGIVPDEVQKLFEKFYRGRNLTTERGLGLGLAICRSVIKAHGGTIWAENRSHGGAAFRFTLPLK